MFDIIAGLCVALLLAALYAVVRRRATHARRRDRHSRAGSPQGRTLSARTEMRAYSSAATTSQMLKKRTRHVGAPTSKRA